MIFKEQLKVYKQEIDQALVKFFDRKIKAAKQYGRENQFLVKALAEYTLGGGRPKRIRGALARVAYELHGGRNRSAIMDVALALELYHSFLLIHDDIIDRDDMRHCLPTIHRGLEEHYQGRFGQQAKHFGMSGAILAGDLAYMFANELLAGSKFSPQQTVSVLTLVSRNLELTGYGQLLDTLGATTRRDIMTVNRIKTALYTFVNPLLAGALYVGMHNLNLNSLKQAGLDLGIAYQIQNDIIGLFGSFKHEGRPSGSDIRGRKNTLLIFEAQRRGSRTEQAVINRVWKKRKVLAADIKAVQEVVAKSGSLSYNQKIARDLVKKAKASLGKLKRVNPQAKQFLMELADHTIERER